METDEQYYTNAARATRENRQRIVEARSRAARCEELGKESLEALRQQECALQQVARDVEVVDQQLDAGEQELNNIRSCWPLLRWPRRRRVLLPVQREEGEGEGAPSVTAPPSLQADQARAPSPTSLAAPCAPSASGPSASAQASHRREEQLLEQELQALSGDVERLAQLSLGMSAELDQHSRLLDGLAENTDSVASRTRALALEAGALARA